MPSAKCEHNFHLACTTLTICTENNLIKTLQSILVLFIFINVFMFLSSGCQYTLGYISFSIVLRYIYKRLKVPGQLVFIIILLL